MAKTRGGYGTVSQTNFSGGLNLASRPDLLRPDHAINLMNVNFLADGGLQQRDGWEKVTTSTFLAQAHLLMPFYTGSNRRLLAANGNSVHVIFGFPSASVTYANPVTSYARFGTPTQELMYFATSPGTLQAYDGSVFATPTFPVVTPTPKYLAVQSPDNRMVLANEAAFPSRVRFSDPGTPGIVQTNSFVDLRPGNGEQITGAVSWREFTFVFKETEFFVFYGNSTDSVGSPVFNYRAVSNNAGSTGPITVAPEGVYFVNSRGMWLTTGGPAKLISRAVEGIFIGTSSLYYSGGIVSAANSPGTRLQHHDGKLYMAFSTLDVPALGVNNRLLVYDPAKDRWTLFDIPTTALISFSMGGDWQNRLVFGIPSTLNAIGSYREGSGITTDGLVNPGPFAVLGATIFSYWQQAWLDYGSPDQKHLRQTKVWGKGNLQFDVTYDYRNVWPSDFASITFDTLPSVIAPWLVSRSVVGHVMSAVIQNNIANTTWSLYQIEHGFRHGRAPEVLGKA